jgi:hypothetical protein
MTLLPELPARGTSPARADTTKVVWFFLGVTLLGVAGVGCWVAGAGVGLPGFGAGLLVMAAAALGGGVVGLLFGIPKSRSNPGAAGPRHPMPQTPGAPSEDQSGYAANSNLEEVSDWLTKIIVGVGLTQLSPLLHRFNRMAAYLAPAVAPYDPAAAPAIGVMMFYGLAVGFLAGYLLTRLYLPGAFNRADDFRRVQQQLAATQQAVLAARQTSLVVRDAVGKIYTDLHRFDQRGFLQAIDRCLDLLGRPGQSDNAQIWYYLAAAYGQAARFALVHQPDTAERASETQALQEKAYEAAHKAIEFGPSWKSLLQMLWDPGYAGKPPDENDLEVFYSEDPGNRFRQLLGPGA